MTETDTLTILHLTDLHRRLGGYAGWNYPNFEQLLIEDLKRLHEVVCPWDLVCFTGDLVQSGGGAEGKEFGKLDETLDRLWDEFKRLGSDPQLLTVCGNHDLVRPDGERPAVKSLQRWENDPSLQEAFWSDGSSEVRSVVAEAFSRYQAWEENRPPRGAGAPVKRGMLPGDFCFEFEKGGVRIGIVGMNTSFLQLSGDSYEAKLALHPAQLSASLGPYFTDWFERYDFCILMTHHPPEWLTPKAREDYLANIAPPNRFLVHLCGHLHSDRSEAMILGGEHHGPT